MKIGIVLQKDEIKRIGIEPFIRKLLYIHLKRYVPTKDISFYRKEINLKDYIDMCEDNVRNMSCLDKVIIDDNISININGFKDIDNNIDLFIKHTIGESGNNNIDKDDTFIAVSIREED